MHCVIIGFGLHDAAEKRIFDYETVQSEPHEIRADNINPYLVDAPDVILNKRSSPISSVPEINYGSMAIDYGHLLLTDEEKAK